MQQTRVVITGLGAITPIGLSVEDFWSNLVAGQSGIDYITRFDTTDFPVKVAAEVKGFDPTPYMDRKTIRRTATFTQWAVVAAIMAARSANLTISPEESSRTGVVIATTGAIYDIGEETLVLREKGPNRIDPLFATKIAAHMAAVQVGKQFGARGPNTTINSACASGNDAIGAGLNFIRMGIADVMIVGGTETVTAPVAVASLGLIGALSKEKEPKKACRPFDKNRSGFVLGEGAAILILETLEHAVKRGAPILAELAGAGWSFDAHSETAPDPDGQALAIKNAINSAGVSPSEIDYVNAHGTGTKLNDAAETKALKIVLGKRAYKVAISSNKSMVGHLAAAAGAIEALATVLTVKHGIIPPTINYETPDPECDLDYVPNKARNVDVNVCLSNSFGLGGQNCSIIIKRFTL